MDTERQCNENGYSFVPMVAETSGGWGASAMCTLKALSRTVASSEDDAQPALRAQLERLCVGIRRANARAVLRRQPLSSEPGDPVRDALDVLMA